MRQLLQERKRDDSASSWNSQRGPAPGVRWRGGSAPQPPKWNYQPNDLRAFAKFERKVQTWVLQAKNYMTAAEMGLTLYTSLQGEAEAEGELLDLSRINDKNGVQYLLDELRGPLQQKVLFQKRQLLADFENVIEKDQPGVGEAIPEPI